MMPWVIVERMSALPGYEHGYVDSHEPGQAEADWTPIFRSRRVNVGAKVRIHWKAAARFNIADMQSYVFIGRTHMILLEITDDGIFNANPGVVFFARWDKVQNDVAKLTGKQSRFEILSPSGVIGARG